MVFTYNALSLSFPPSFFTLLNFVLCLLLIQIGLLCKTLAEGGVEKN